MAKALLNFVKLSDGNLGSKSTTIATSMVDNASFPNPSPAITAVIDAAEAFNQAVIAASSGNKSDIAVKQSRRNELIVLLRLLVTYVNFASGGNRIPLLTTGFDVSKESSSATPISVPENMKAINGKNPGELELSVNAVKGARGYSHEIRPEDGNGEWQIAMTTSRRYLSTALVSTKRYICRIGVIGTKGQMVYSNQASRVVL